MPADNKKAPLSDASFLSVFIQLASVYAAKAFPE
jgi:hypothetical protein